MFFFEGGGEGGVKSIVLVDTPPFPKHTCTCTHTSDRGFVRTLEFEESC